MLVLARRRSEMIQIGDNIVIKVIETGSRWVKIGIDAPHDIPIVRAELFGIRGPQHPLTAFLQQRRQHPSSQIDDGKSPGVSDMLEAPVAGSSAAEHRTGEVARKIRRDSDDG